MTYFIGDWYNDLCLMENYLDQIEFYSGTERKQMMTKANIKMSYKNCGSMLYGTTWKSYLSPTKNREYDEETGLYKTKVYSENPELKDIYKEFSSLYFPDFEWAQVQMNKNWTTPPHRDTQNIGESVLVCLGNYVGGLTAVDYGQKQGIIKYDATEQPIKFDGSRYLHWVEPYKGDRYSLVFFKNYKLKNS
jgi:hypothetical protein